MYIPAKYREERTGVLHGLIASHPLGLVVTHGADGLSADHIPFEVSAPADDAPFGILRAHVARANPLWRRDGAEVMAVFQGDSR
jgi:transcriptional regulator